MDNSMKAVELLIQKKLLPLSARLDIIEAELGRLERHVADIERRLDELENETAIADDDINNVEETELDETLLEHLMKDSLKQHGIQKNATHISLTIDLSKKNK